jgi:hypothetical protein
MNVLVKMEGAVKFTGMNLIRNIRHIIKTKLLNFIRLIFFTPIQRYFFKNNKGYDKIIWLIGSGRSGTTWVSSLINYRGNFRESFEPFHPVKNVQTANIKFHSYWSIVPEWSKELVGNIFNGRLVSRHLEHINTKIKYENLIVKDIHANLLAFSVAKMLPEVHPILLIRNPLRVAESMCKLKHWDWMEDVSYFLSQTELMNDFLWPFKSLLEKVAEKGTYFDRMILIWAIINYVPLVQFNDSKHLLIVFYERVKDEPLKELERINTYVGSVVGLNESYLQLVLDKPSITSNIQNRNSDIDKISNLSITILKVFGFLNLYDLQTGKLNFENSNNLQKDISSIYENFNVKANVH